MISSPDPHCGRREACAPSEVEDESLGASKKKAKKTQKTVRKAAKKGGKLFSKAADKALKSLGGANKLRMGVRKVAEATADALVDAITPKKKKK